MQQRNCGRLGGFGVFLLVWLPSFVTIVHYAHFAGNGLNVIKIMPESAIKFGAYEVSSFLALLGDLIDTL